MNNIWFTYIHPHVFWKCRRKEHKPHGQVVCSNFDKCIGQRKSACNLDGYIGELAPIDVPWGDSKSSATGMGDSHSALLGK